MSSIPIAEQGRMTSPQEESRPANDQERPLRSVYVVDDEIQVLEVMQLQLAAADYRVRTFGNARSFLAAVDTLDPGVVITDQKMPEMNGLELQEQLQARAHQFRIILLSGYPETRVAVQAMKQGAVTVLDKPYNKDHLFESIEEAFQVLNRAMLDEKGLPPPLPGEKYIDRLSDRERQVIDYVYEGATNKKIAILLGISIKTVEKHRGKAMKKLNVSSLAELIRLIDREQGT